MPPIDPVIQDVLVSSAIILTTLVLSKLVRKGLTEVVRPGLTLQLLLEGVATFELCACSFEQGLLFELDGKRAFATALFLITLWRSYHWKNVSTIPYAHLESWIAGAIPLVTMLAFVAVELGFGSTVYNYYTKPIWGLQLSGIHARKVASTSCTTLVRVNYIRGALVEGLCTFFCGMLLRLVFSIRSLEGVAPVLKSFVVTSFVMTGFDYTGGHMHPVLASVKQFGCTGITAYQHVFVYWVGACTGGVMAYFVWNWWMRVRSGGGVKKVQ